MKNKKILLVISIIIVVAIIIAFSVTMINKNKRNQNIENLKERDEKEYIVSIPSNNNISGQFTDKKITDSNLAISSIKDVSNQLNIDLSKYKFIEEKSDTTGDYFNTYKLKQAYNGLEIYGSELIVYTDKNGNAKGLINGCVDINNDIETSPQTSIMDIIDGIIEQRLNELEINSNDVTSSSDLVIYPYNNRFILVHIVYIHTDLGIITFFVNDENQEIIDENYNMYGIKSLSDVSDFKVSNTDEYKLKDYSRNINVNYITYSGYSKDKPKVKLYEWKTVSEANGINVNLGINTLETIIKVYDYYYNRLNRISISGDTNRAIEVCTGLDKEKSGFWMTYYYSGNACYRYGDNADFIIYGSKNLYNQDIEVSAHEYTHGVFRHTIGETISDKLETGAVNEAYADIMGMCAEAFYNNENEKIDGIINNLDRNIKDSNMKLGDFGNDKKLEAHDYSVILSRVAYIMNRDFSAKEIEQLWYNSMKLLRSDCSFYNSMYAVIETSKMMEFTEEQQEKIRSAFYEMGFEKITITNPLEHTAENKNELLTETGQKTKDIIGVWKAVDTNNSNYPLGYIYGSGFKRGEITFNEDGTYSLFMGITFSQNGKYSIEKNKIVLKDNVLEGERLEADIIKKFSIQGDKIIFEENIDGMSVDVIFER